MTELTEAGGPCSTKMSMRQFKRYGIVDVHASLRLIEKSCNQKERTPHRDVQYTVGRLITTEDQCLKQQDALPCYPSDDALTIAVLTDANVPSLLNTDVKI